MTIKIIGIGDNGTKSLPSLYETFINESDWLVGGERLLKFFPNYQGQKIPIKGKLTSLVKHIQSLSGKGVILASGDPLFFGIGSYLAKKVNAIIYPNVSSIQLAFSKINEGWQDAKIISVHGRSMKGLAQKIDGEDKVALLTDHKNTPAVIASYLLTYNMFEYEAFVAENLGGIDERTGWYTLPELEQETFSPLNVVLLKRKYEGPKWSIGIDDAEFYQRKPEKGLITKKEIRTLSIANLNIESHSVVWDIGTCTGSIAIEAARIAKDGAVFAIEKNKADLQNCYKNMRKFRTDFTVVHGLAPDRLDEFKDPDAIFIGGTAGNLESILQVCSERLKENGTIVLNAVTIDTLYDAMNTFERLDFDMDITLSQISRSKPILHMTRFDALNPIYIITAKRKKRE